MKHILLLGAGFSRNWGGWLASEAFEYLLGSPEILKNPSLKKLLWDHKQQGGFESALAAVQQEHLRAPNADSKAQLDAFQAAVARMFHDMNKVFVGMIDMEFSNEIGSRLCEVLVKFDAIFTLNQDLLLERHYMNGNVTVASMQKWLGAGLPGVQRLPRPGTMASDLLDARWQVGPGPYVLAARTQPIFKLHGSSNWLDATGSDLMVIGGDKSGVIKSKLILRWYFEQFVAYLSEPRSRIMVIGYSFGDQHINDAMLAAARNNQLGIFIVDPIGVDVVNKTRNKPMRVPDPFEEVLIGASRRSLREIFGGDGVELGKIKRFFSA